jgi:hypothetical protein
MSAILVSKGTPTYSTGAQTPNAPASIVVGNWLIAYFGEFQGNDAAPATPANWNLISGTAVNATGIVFARVADGTANDAMPIVNYNSSAKQMSYCEQWSGLAAAVAGNTSASAPRQASLTSGCQISGFTPPSNNMLILGLMCRNKTSNSDGATWSNFTGGGGTFTQNASNVPTGINLMWLAESLQQTVATAFSLGASNNSSPADSTGQSSVGYLIAIQTAQAYVPTPPMGLGGMNVQVCM